MRLQEVALHRHSRHRLGSEVLLYPVAGVAASGGKSVPAAGRVLM
jgi:hypothetical protein